MATRYPYEPRTDVRMMLWIKEIKKGITDYLGIKVIIGTPKIRSEENDNFGFGEI